MGRVPWSTLIRSEGSGTSILLMRQGRRSQPVHIMSINNERAQYNSRELWIGLVEVRPERGDILGDAKGALVHVVTWASDKEEYRRNADLVLGNLGLFVVEVENPEPVAERRKEASFEEEIEDMIARAQDIPNAIIYGTFHTWERDTA
jgi:hypothetical protein